MKTQTLKNSLLLILFACSIVFLSSCEDDEKATLKNDPAKHAKAEQVLEFRKEMDFVNRFVDSNVAMTSEEGRTSIGRTMVARLTEVAPCAEGTEEELQDGSIKVTLNFGAGCETEEGIVVAGEVEMIFTVTETSIAYSIEFINYSEINEGEQGETINGTVTGLFIYDFETGVFVQEMEQDLTITYANNTEASFKIAQKAEMTETGLRVVELQTSGNFEDGGQFSMTLSKALVYDFNCTSDLPVQGEEILMFQGNTIRVNYGTGSCDESYIAN